MNFDQPRAYGQMVVEGIQRNARKLRLGRIWASITLASPAELVMVPQDLRTIDPVLAQEFYHGNYSFVGRHVDTKGNSPFNLPPKWENASLNWRRELHSFRWFRHLDSAKNRILSTHAQSLIKDWINNCGKPGDNVAWQPDIAAKRLISWLSHSVVIVDGADAKLYDQFLYSIGTHIRYLNNIVHDAPDGLPKLQVRLALTYAALCVKLYREPKGVSALRPHLALANVLSQQIFADGGHISRCPSVLPEILIDLLPLRQSYDWLGIKPPQELLTSIDRMMPAVRFYQHRDGSFARFNGVNSAQRELISVVLRYDDAMGEPTQEATQSQYQRLTGGPTTLIMDVGKPPRGELSVRAHAGCLSFEMSSIRTCFITNCGAPQINDEKLIMASRSTAAHSTAVLNSTSSCRFQNTGFFTSDSGRRVLAGPGRVSSERKKLDGYWQVAARHDGYLRQFGVWHERVLQLSDDGTNLFGRDRFFIQGEKPPTHLKKDECTIRFHLHPSVSAIIDAEMGAIIIQASENQRWVFNCDLGRVGLEESVYFSKPGGPVPTSQIVINLELSKNSTVNWKFEQSIGTRMQ